MRLYGFKICFQMLASDWPDFLQMQILQKIFPLFSFFRKSELDARGCDAAQPHRAARFGQGGASAWSALHPTFHRHTHSTLHTRGGVGYCTPTGRKKRTKRKKRFHRFLFWEEEKDTGYRGWLLTRRPTPPPGPPRSRGTGTHAVAFPRCGRCGAAV
jgi:hypothetical protein